ncbi:MAG: hypothetical protein ACI4JI_07215 [Ruminiclostridium sp.]
MKNSSECKKQLNDGSDYSEMQTQSEQPHSEQPHSQQTINDSSTVKKPKTKTAFICAAAAAVAVTAGVLFFVLSANNGGEPEASSVSSIAGGEPEASSVSSIAGGEDSAVSNIQPTIDPDASADADSVTDDSLPKYLYEKDLGVYLSQNGKQGFELLSAPFGDYRVIINKDGSKLAYRIKNSLYIRDTDKDSEPVLLTDSVITFDFCDDQSALLFRTGSGEICRYKCDTAEIKKVIINANSNFSASQDGSKAAVTDSDGMLNIIDFDTDSTEKIDSYSTYSPIFTSDDYSQIYYVKDNTVYRKKSGCESETLASGAVVIKSVDFETGAFYYYGIYKEDAPNELYYCKDGKSVCVASSDRVYLATENSNDEVLVVCEEKDDICEYRLVRGENSEKVDFGGKIFYANITDDGNRLYYSLKQEDETYTLYTMDISGGASMPEEIDSGINNGKYIIKDGKTVYSKDNEGLSYDLYIDGEKIDGNIPYGHAVMYNDGGIYYLTDYDKSVGKGTLKCFKSDGKTETIAENVHNFEVAQSGELLYISDVAVLDIDFEKYVGGGDLYVYKNGESKLIDSGVTDIIINGSDLDHFYLW